MEADVGDRCGGGGARTARGAVPRSVPSHEAQQALTTTKKEPSLRWRSFLRRGPVQLTVVLRTSAPRYLQQFSTEPIVHTPVEHSWPPSLTHVHTVPQYRCGDMSRNTRIIVYHVVNSVAAPMRSVSPNSMGHNVFCDGHNMSPEF